MHKRSIQQMFRLELLDFFFEKSAPLVFDLTKEQIKYRYLDEHFYAFFLNRYSYFLMISFLLSIRQGFRMTLLIVYISCVMALSLLPPNDLPHVKVFEGFDKVVHFLMYFPLALLLCWNLRADEQHKRIFLATILSVAWGIYMEFLQLTMHLGRSFSWYDELANLAGSVFGVWLFSIVVKNFGEPVKTKKAL